MKHDDLVSRTQEGPENEPQKEVEKRVKKQEKRKPKQRKSDKRNSRQRESIVRFLLLFLRGISAVGLEGRSVW
jgi:hypothetical protein